MSGSPTITDEEFAAMEALLARLLASAGNPHEEAKILSIHGRIERIHATSKAHQAARERLLSRLLRSKVDAT